MALSLKLLVCLLFVSCAYLRTATATTTLATTVTTNESTVKASTTAEATTKPTVKASTTAEATTKPTVKAPTTTEATTEPTGKTPDPTGKTTQPAEGTAEPPTTETPGPCESNPCGEGSTCEERLNTAFVCLCLAGDFYDEGQKICVPAKVFPGEVTTKDDYKQEMEDKASVEFNKTAQFVIDKLNEAFGPKTTKIYLATPTGYLSSTVTGLSKGENNKAEATIDIMFGKASNANKETVKTTVETAFGGFKAKSLCDSNPCDADTTNCTDTDGIFKCECTDKYIKTDFSDRVCVACPKGWKAEGGECVKCGFGNSGFNCEDKWQLILVIVGCVLGALLLITTIMLPVVAMSSKKKLKKAKTTNKEKSYSNPAPAKTPQVSNGFAAPRPTPAKAAPAGGLSGFGGNVVPRIPRATANDNWDRNTNLEMMSSNSRQNLIPSGRNSRRFDDDDDMNPYSRPTKPQNNPYAMGRPQINPYGSSQGQSNPYFRH